MRSASNALTQSIASVSNVIDQNAATADKFGHNSESVLSTIRPVTEYADIRRTRRKKSPVRRPSSPRKSRRSTRRPVSRAPTPRGLRALVSAFSNVEVAPRAGQVIPIAGQKLEAPAESEVKQLPGL